MPPTVTTRTCTREARVSKVFVDTWAWYALADAADAKHRQAQQMNERLLDEGHTFVTTNFVAAEAATMIRYNLRHAAAMTFWKLLKQSMAAGFLEYVRITEAHEKEALGIFEKYADQDFLFTDCTSFAVMRSQRLTLAFTADHHFSVLGFTLLV